MLRLLVSIILITFLQLSFLEVTSGYFLLIPVPLMFIYLWQYTVNVNDTYILILGYALTLIMFKFSIAIITLYILIILLMGILVYFILAQKSLYGLISGATILFILNFLLVRIFHQENPSILIYPIFIIICYSLFLLVSGIFRNLKVYG